MVTFIQMTAYLAVSQYDGAPGSVCAFNSAGFSCALGKTLGVGFTLDGNIVRKILSREPGIYRHGISRWILSDEVANACRNEVWANYTSTIQQKILETI